MEERGVADNIVNVPLPEMAGSPEFRHAMTTRIFPALEHFQPELIMISAGFDAHTRDPLASLHLVDDDYVWVTRKLGEFAREYCGARIVSTLEGVRHSRPCLKLRRARTGTDGGLIRRASTSGDRSAFAVRQPSRTCGQAGDRPKVAKVPW